MPRGTLTLLLAAPLLSACVAVAALPLLAGGAMIGGGNAKIRAATPRPKQAATLAPRLAPERTAGMPVAAGSGVVLTNLTALPPPDAVRAAADPWQRFFDFAAGRAAGFAERREPKSALLVAGTSLMLPQMRDCAAEVPAVVVDLDAGQGTFAPVQGQAAAPALIEGLTRVREAGAVVVWLSALPAARVGEVAETLRASGLDPEGRDPLLLVRSPDDRKQALRDEANRDVCVIAIAGDRKGDFDELFDYLRDPHAGDSLDFLLGSGWFLVPPPLN